MRGTKSAATKERHEEAPKATKEGHVLRDEDGNPVDPSLVEFAGGGFGHAAVGVGAMALGGIAAMGLAVLGAFGAYYMASSVASATGRTMVEIGSNESTSKADASKSSSSTVAD